MGTQMCSFKKVKVRRPSLHYDYIPPYCNHSSNENFLFSSCGSSIYWTMSNFTMLIHHTKDFYFDIAKS